MVAVKVLSGLATLCLLFGFLWALLSFWALPTFAGACVVGAGIGWSARRRD